MMSGEFLRSEASESLMSQAMCALVKRRRIRLTVGSACTTSPSELGLMIRMRMCDVKTVKRVKMVSVVVLTIYRA